MVRYLIKLLFSIKFKDKVSKVLVLDLFKQKKVSKRFLQLIFFY